ncbi:uncharacterized protein [Heptranchias perlo]|uniref:uncharacterized protein n=1 Tax=Heptranchias perlo TaxID=212740 RepID=UPI00355A33CC
MRRCGPSAAAELYSITICNFMTRHIPHSTIINKPGDQPRLNEECRRACQEQHQAYLKMRCQPGEATTQDYMYAKQWKQHAIDRAKRFHNQRIRSKLCNLATSSREWWWTIKQLTGEGDFVNIPILNNGRVQHVSAKAKAEGFATIFSRKCRVDDPSRPPPKIPTIAEASLQPIRLTPRDIKKRLSALDTAKAMGPDNIPAVVLKTCAPEPTAPLAKLKLMEGVIDSAIKRHLLTNNLLTDAQFGFRQDHSAPDLIAALVQTWTKELNSRGEVRVTALTSRQHLTECGTKEP